MSDGTRIPLADGAALACRFIAQIADVCERVAIAGSIRRGKASVGDVEIVVRPAQGFEERIAALLKSGVVRPRLNVRGNKIAVGKRYKALLMDNIPVDLFVVLPDRDWGPTMLLRTGPGDANQVLVTASGRINSNGDRGIAPDGLTWKDGAILWHGERIQTAEERDVFDLLDLPWVPPHMRTVAVYHRLAERTERIAGYRRAFVGHKPPPAGRDAVYWLVNEWVVPHFLAWPAFGEIIEQKELIDGLGIHPG